MILSDFNTLEEAQAHEETTVTNKVTSGKARSFFISIGKWAALRTIQTDLTHPLFPLADGIIGVINESSYFGIDPLTSIGQANLAGMNILVSAGFLTQNNVDAFLAMGTSKSHPFANTTQSQFNGAKGVFTSKTVTHTAGKNIVLTLNADLLEKVAATVWLKEVGFADENMGRSVHMQAAQKYRIDMRGKKSGEYEIRVPLLNANFSVESV